MSREATCGPAEARKRAKVARMYLEVAELAAEEEADERAMSPLGTASWPASPHPMRSAAPDWADVTEARTIKAH